MKTLNILATAFIALLFVNKISAQKIDRKALAERNNVSVTSADTLASLTVGNGSFAFTADVTGLQTFPEYYAGGVPLGTQSEWGWHSLPNRENYKFSETLKAYNFNGGNKQLYAVQDRKPGRMQQAVDYYRSNPHRLQLGNIGFEILKKDGTPALPGDLQHIRQQLNVWNGEIRSSFEIEGIPVNVITCSAQDKDIVAVRVVSPLLKEQRLKIKIRFPYPSNEFSDAGTNYGNESRHQTEAIATGNTTVTFTRSLDNDRYYLCANAGKKITVHKVREHYYTLIPQADTAFSCSFTFASAKPVTPAPGFYTIQNKSRKAWNHFWLTGAVVDFSGSTDVRAAELERRVVLSQYLTRVQCAGNFPPQETGLTYNSWYGRPHMEMHWWHVAHYALWGRPELMEKSMQWYFRAFTGAKKIAERQGYKGVRWQKMTDHDGGEAPSSVGSFLIWQQPHIIYMAELLYRDHPSAALLKKYQPLIFATADFMASFASYDSITGKYNLGKGIIPAQECFNPAETFNSPYELAYWKWALQAAQQWRIRMGFKPDKNWQVVIDKLAAPTQKEGVYTAAQSVSDSYSPQSKFTIDHPAVLAALSTLPANNFIDTAIMKRTYDTIEQVWHWDHTWGWDFPMIAMTATRLNQPDYAMDALFKNIKTNTYLINGHNYQNDRLTIYLPGNGSLLSAVALMCAGYDGNKQPDPGIPRNGKWKVKWEGLKPMP